MKKRLLTALLTLTLAVTMPLPSAALTRGDFSGGQPSDVLVIGEGKLLVTDTYNKVLWVTDGDAVENYAGVIPVPDLSEEPRGIYRDGASDKAYFVEPWAIAPYLEGYAVTDAGANRIRYVTDKKVQTLAGMERAGKDNGTGRSAAFERPTGIAADGDGSLYVADTGNGLIRKITKAGRVTTWASGLADPTGICWADGSLYVAETGRSRILKLTDGKTEVLTGLSTDAEDDGEWYGGYVDGLADKARFDHPQGVAVGSDGSVYIADTGNGALRVLRDGRVYTLLRSSSTGAAPIRPRGLAVDGETLYAADPYAGTVLTLSANRTLTFSDVSKDAWYADTVAAAVDRGLTNGMGEGRYDPAGSVTRAQAVTFLARICQSADGTVRIDGDGAFVDVPDDAWYAPSVRWAVDAGVTRGVSSGFAPNAEITREQLVTMLYRFALSQDYDVTGTPEDDLEGYSDRQSVGSWALSAVRWAVGAGILKGTDGRLMPQGAATRAEVSAILIRFMDVCGL